MNTRHFFITGGHGILGLEMVGRLLRDHESARITLLIRARRGQTPDQRLDVARRWIRSAWPDTDDSRLEAVSGDVSLHGLGLDAALSARLRASVTDIVNAAATTRLDADPAQAWAVNVFGTMQCLDFARSCRRLRLYAHVSTAYVCGDREGLIRETDGEAGQRFLNTYEASKFEAEMRVRESGGDLPVTILRPSIIVGDSRTGRIAAFGSFYHVVRAIASGELRRIPCREGGRLDLVPIDYVAECAVRLIERPGAGEAYHLCAGPGRRTGIRRLFETAIAVSGHRGESPLRFLPFGGDPESAMDTVWKYPRLDREFSDARARAHLGGRPERPCPDDFLLPVVRYGCRGLRPSPTREEVERCHAPSVAAL